MVTEKQISVLLPVLNGQDTLNQAIESTLRALGEQDELLVLIQGPNLDDYRIGEIKDERLRVFYKDQAEGIAKALNYLVTKAQGKFVARMDQDDICLKSRFRKQLRALENRGYDFVFANAILFGKQIRPFGFIPQLPYGLDSLSSNLILPIRNPFIHPTMLAKRSALEALGYFRPSVAEDYDLWLRAASKGFKLGKLRSFGILYRVHGQQFSQSTDFKRRVEDDLYISESKSALITTLVGQGILGTETTAEDQLKTKLRKGNLAFRLQWSPVGARLLRFANALLTKKN
jgi:glycosyltransferase involved in cell wall biosynthesis